MSAGQRSFFEQVRPKYFEPRDGDGRTALMRASARGDEAAVGEYLAFSDALLVDHAGRSSLMLAVGRGSVPCAGKLLPYSDACAAGPRGETALIAAAGLRGAEGSRLVELLLGASDESAQDALGCTALLHACDAGCVESAMLLANSKAARVADDRGNTPLMVAVMMRSREMVSALLPLSDIAAKNVEGWSALALAQGKNETDIEELIEGFERARKESLALEKAAKKALPRNSALQGGRH
jgi:ankyrin repeat protein